MFTGIIKRTGTVQKVEKCRGGLAIEVAAPRLSLKKGASVAVNGICSTVVSSARNSLSIFYIPETIRKTTVVRWKKGERVNLEESMRFGDEVGGHLVSGHIDGVGTITALVREGESRLLKIEAPRMLLRYMIPKGSVAIDGVSLTLADVGDDWFSVALIPYTLAHTNLGKKKTGDRVNLECDMLGKYLYTYAKK